MSWGSYGTSTGSLDVGGYVEFTNDQDTTLRAIGLIPAPFVPGTQPPFDDLSYAWYFDSASVWVVESGVFRSVPALTTAAIPSTFRISIGLDRVVSYQKNNVTLYTSLITASLPLYVGAVMDDVGARFTGVTIGTRLAPSGGSDPQVMLSLSNDGGKTFGPEMWRSMGKRGEYLTRVRWNRLGCARRRVFEVAVTDPVPWRLTGSYVESFSSEKS